MNYYPIIVFLHIAGALGLFVALGLEWTSLQYIRSATTSEKVAEWMHISNTAVKFGIASMLTILASGIYMMATVWGGVTWIIVALGTLILMIVLSVSLTRSGMVKISRVMNTERGPVSPTLHALVRQPRLQISIQTRIAIAIGIVYLMTVKPDLEDSLFIISVAIALGLALSLPAPRQERVQEESAD